MRNLISTKLPKKYWTRHLVSHEEFKSIEHSLRHYEWRNRINIGQLSYMPVDDVANKVILDYGCGPGNDVIGFLHYGNPLEMYACDVSATALKAATQRVSLHRKKASFSLIDENLNLRLPYEDKKFDLIHSSGVLHHTSNLNAILCEFSRVLKDDGEIRIMVYNKDSIWWHLYVNYRLMIREGTYKGLTAEEVFRHSTDGEACPISKCYSSKDFLKILSQAGFKASFLGSGISILELNAMRERWDAVGSVEIDKENAEFLAKLTIDQTGIPRVNGVVAGIYAYYSARK